jgi:hypothetical protein
LRAVAQGSNGQFALERICMDDVMEVGMIHWLNAPSIEINGSVIKGMKRTAARILIDLGAMGLIINQQYVLKNALSQGIF